MGTVSAVTMASMQKRFGTNTAARRAKKKGGNVMPAYLDVHRHVQRQMFQMLRMRRVVHQYRTHDGYKSSADLYCVLLAGCKIGMERVHSAVQCCVAVTGDSV